MNTNPDDVSTGPHPEKPEEGGAQLSNDGAPWWSLSGADASARLGAGPEGLDSEEAKRRLERYGPNTIEVEEVEPWWVLALHQFKDPLIYILLAAAAVTIAIEDYVDAGVILTVVLLNAVIGFVQEYRARQAMRALAKLSAPRAEVLRDGRSRTVPAAEVVPGDVVLLSSGVRVPADLRLLRVVGLDVDESMLTGESVSVSKDPERMLEGDPVAGDQVNMAFAATMVTRGRGRGVVVATGRDTAVGRIAEAVHRVGEVRTPLQEKVHDFGGKVGLALVGLAGVAAGLGLLHGLGLAEIFMTAVAMAVSAVPEGLPVVLTVTLAVGVRRMAGRKAIVRRLPAVETLGSTTVIASDKTGTLTRNEMTVRAIWTTGGRLEVSGAGYAAEGELRRGDTVVVPDGESALSHTLRAGVLASEADERILGDEGEPLGDPTEVALLVAAAKGGMRTAEERAAHPDLSMLPFEPELQFMATLVRVGADNRIYMKGAPEAVLSRCTRVATEDGGTAPLDEDERRRIRDAGQELAGEGLRVLAMAYRDTQSDTINAAAVEDDMVFCGLQGMEDPVRPEAVDAVAVVRDAGIRVLMLTGDHVATARAIGRRLGLDDEGHRAVEGRELGGLSDGELDALLDEGVRVFARVAPEHKLRIVERLRARGEIVAVTGDGVNDAPALRAAHLGIAMGITGTDVAREASDMVLQDDNFATIRAAVEEGRVVFANIRKVTFFLLSTAVGEVITILVALAAGWPLPFVAAQILWINLVTNGLQDVALAVEPGEPGLLRRGPRPAGEGILPWRLLERLGGVGVVLAIGTLGAFWWAWRMTEDLDTARTVAMTQMVVFQFFHVFNCRSLERSIFRVPLLSNRFLFVSLLAALVAQLAVLYWGPLQAVFRTVPLDVEQWGVVVAVGATVVIGGELDKAWQRRRGRALG
ncbi:MAG: HAD-IC family P-type ATPase [Gemmatimonadota bacterium]|nr:HAD-IC family P-type ATPase [Gemmatimonadota bacterium]